MGELFVKEIPPADVEDALELPYYWPSVPAGFPSPAANYIEDSLDLNKYLIKRPAATFFVRVEGDSMTGAGIYSGDILIVDRAINAKHNDIVVVALGSEMTVKRLTRNKGRVYLTSENPLFSPIEIQEDAELLIWGVVTYNIHKPS